MQASGPVDAVVAAAVDAAFPVSSGCMPLLFLLLLLVLLLLLFL